MKYKKKNRFGFKGRVHLQAVHNGTTFYDRTIDNLFMDVGRAIAASRLGSNGEEVVHSIAAGDDGTAANATQTGLVGSLLAYNTSATFSVITTSVTLDTGKWVAVLNFASASTVREVALGQAIDLDITGMMSRVVVSPAISMPAGSALTVTWTLQCT